jgi:hypothetical protein
MSLIVLVAVVASALVATGHRFDPALPLPVHTHELFHDKSVSAKRRLGIGSELTPLYQGYGTHFSYIYVGTPPQRQSVIVDTGSHYTAFPCTGCQQCGKHTDEYFDIKKSSTSSTLKCGSSTCNIHQSYAEGSSWNAIKVQDQLWVGGLTQDLVQRGSNYSVAFTFGCQTSETGLFRTQLADGIMGMSMSEDVLPSQLFAQKVVDTRMFAMCFRVGGGIMTIGGVNQKIHKKGGLMSSGQVPVLQLSYAKLLHPAGSVWYTVNLLDIMLQPQDGSAPPASLGATHSQLNTGKGVIVDSGTTDTYLPASLKTKFTTAFNKLAGVYYTESDIKLTAAQLARMPNIVFVLEDTEGNPFSVTMPWTNYVDNVGGDKYAFRVYLTEGSGSVLGANFMNNYNVIFDRDNNRVGFASSSCIFEDYAKEDVQDEELDVFNKTISGIDTENSSDGCTSVFVPTSKCSARCDPNHSPDKYIAEGVQSGIDNCRQSKNGLDNSLPNKPCHELCDKNVIAVGRSPECIVSKWSDCASNCSQWRVGYRNTRHAHSRRLHPSNHTGRALDTFCGTSYIESRTCNAASCPIKGASGSDYLVFIDMKINIPATLWSYAYVNTFEETLAELFMIPGGSLEILTGAGSHDLADFVKIRFEIRLRASSFDNDIAKMVKHAEGIPAAVFLDDFNARFLQGLVQTSKRMDGLDFDRYGWLKTSDIDIINSMAIPLGGTGPKAIEGTGGTISGTNVVLTQPKQGMSNLEIALIVLIVIVGVVLICMLHFHMKLREEHRALSMQNMAYLQEYEGKLFDGGGKASKMIGKVWNGVKDGVKSAIGGKAGTEKGKSRRKDTSSSSSISHSMQSISSVISSATGMNARTRDTHNPMRNSYKYDQVPRAGEGGDIQLSSMERGGNPELVVAGEDESESNNSGSSEGSDDDDDFGDSRLDLKGFKEVAASSKY